VHERTLGQGPRVSAAGLGCMGMSQSCGPNPGDRDSMITVLRDAGVTFFDTAEVHCPYVNEELVGEALAPLREQVVVATKFGWRIEDGKSAGLDSRPEQIARVADASRSTCPTNTASTPTCRSRTSPALSANSSRPARCGTSVCQRPPRRPSAALTSSTPLPRCRENTRCGPATPNLSCCRPAPNSGSDSSRSAHSAKDSSPAQSTHRPSSPTETSAPQSPASPPTTATPTGADRTPHLRAVREHLVLSFGPRRTAGPPAVAISGSTTLCDPGPADPRARERPRRHGSSLRTRFGPLAAGHC
jgi:Aldo/keto reductase family